VPPFCLPIHADIGSLFSHPISDKDISPNYRKRQEEENLQFSVALRICDSKAQLAERLNICDNLSVHVERYGNEALPDEDLLGLYEDETLVSEYHKAMPRDYYFRNLQDRSRIVSIPDGNCTFRQIVWKLDKIPGRCGFELEGRDLELGAPLFFIFASSVETNFTLSTTACSRHCHRE
jgi:hypothetical protein